MAGLTVLFATHNGAPTLPRMLDALECLEVPLGGFKIVAVDNASTDATAALIKAREARLPITLIHELRPGKNAALNKGLGSIEGDLVVLTDDDVIPRPDWLVSIRNLADELPHYDIFGGAIHPVWDEAPPEWVMRCVYKGMFAWTDFTEGPIEPRKVWGGNMAVRSRIFRDHKFFESVGPNGTRRYASCSEIEFTTRAARAGHRCWHSERVVVGHIVRAYQLTPEWLLQRSFNQGMGARHVAGADCEGDGAFLLDYLQYLKRRLMAAKDIVRSRLFGDFEEQFKVRFRLRYLQGDFAERRLQWRARRTSPATPARARKASAREA